MLVFTGEPSPCCRHGYGGAEYVPRPFPLSHPGAQQTSRISNRSTNEVYEPLTLGHFPQVSKTLQTINYLASLAAGVISATGEMQGEGQFKQAVCSHPRMFWGRRKHSYHIRLLMQFPATPEKGTRVFPDVFPLF